MSEKFSISSEKILAKSGLYTSNTQIMEIYQYVHGLKILHELSFFLFNILNNIFIFSDKNRANEASEQD